MMEWLFRIFLFYFLFISPLFADSYFAATHAKGGTHLLLRTLCMIDAEKPTKLFCHYDGRRFSSKQLDDYIKEGGLPFIHLFTPHFTYRYLLSHHLDSKVIVIIRDIRDAFVSYAYWAHKKLDLSIEEKISRVFYNKAYCEMSNNLSLFLNNPRFYVVRFEDLIGPMGGGNQEAQTKTIYQLAAYIDKPISEETAAHYGSLLFGNSDTFRKGMIGSWKEYFTDEQIRLFKEKFGGELIRLGYEKDTNW